MFFLCSSWWSHKVNTLKFSSGSTLVYERYPVHSGSFGSIHQAQYKCSKKAPQEVALKITCPKRCRIDEALFIKELQEEPEVIHVWDTFYDQRINKLYIAMDLCAQDLFDYIDDHRYLEVTKIKYITKWLLHAVQHCHNHRIVHSDIKMGNIGLLVQDDLSSLKLLDFGNAKRIDFKKCYGAEGFLSSPSTACPEMISGDVLHGEEAFGIDVWAVGVVLYSMIHQRFPFPFTTSPVFHITFKELYFTKDTSTDYLQAKDLINKLLEWDYKKRIQIEEALQHPFITS